MSSIDVKRFVDINIIKHETSAIESTRSTVVLFTNEIQSVFDITFNTYAEVLSNATVNATTNTKKYAQVYFENNGNKLRIIKDAATQTSLLDAITALNNEFIVIAVVNADETYTILQPIATTRAQNTSVYGVNEKLLLARINSFDSITPAKNLVVKYSSVIGAEMTIAAYLSNINVYASNSIQDYAFTKEYITAEVSDDTILGNVLSNNFNVDMYLSNATRNLGGNITNGDDLVNKYVLIILHQTLTERVLDLLSQKIKGVSALSSLYSVLSQELSRYVSSGYLYTDKVWTEPDLKIIYNSKQYDIISQSTALLLGYKITILPLSSLTDADKAAHKAPLIYVILADSYGIRQVTINGEII